MVIECLTSQLGRSLLLHDMLVNMYQYFCTLRTHTQFCPFLHDA